MGADEEYLDNLLKSVTADLAGEEKTVENETISAEETFSVEDLFGTQEPFFVENEAGEAEEVSIDDLIFGDDMPVDEVEDGDTPLDIDAMLKELNLLNDDMTVPGLETAVEVETEAETEVEKANLTQEETDPMAEPFYSGDLDDDLNEINSLLEKADNNEAIDEDMLTMFSATNTVSMEDDEPFDLMGAINSQESSAPVDDKKAEKERKRREKEAAKEAKKAAKETAKAQKKSKKEKENAEPIAQETPLMPTQAEQTPNEEESAFSSFQEVEEFDDIEALLGSLNMDDLEFTTAPIENNDSSTEPEQMLSMADLRADGDVAESADAPVESKKEKKKEQKEKKEGLFKRFVDFLMEEDEEDEEDNKKKKKKVQAVDTNDENSDVMAELEKRGKKAEKAKKANKNKKGPGDDEDEVDDKKGKKKAKKPKKEKQPQSEMAKKFKVIDGDKKIGKAGSLAVVLLAASVFAVVMLSNIVFSPLLAKNRAEKAFNEQDYETCYQELSGWDLNENEAQMRDFSKVVLKMERRLDAYEQYKGLRQKLEALDSLMRAVQNYDEIYQEALNCGAESEVEARYDIIMNLLSEEYGLSEKDAKAIATLESDVEYTRYLTAIIEGKSLSSPDSGKDEELPGFLQEEEELPDTKFSE